ncbi:Glycosyltransferase (GlcNAc) [Burkholderiales bacterium JOSHI_001]|nr:Glycosyltransferase (GlcNAc) [Burkholderiales bacterium JOSHI_001]
MSDERIFVSVASYCDPLLGFTLDSALSQARHPQRLRFGVVDQSPPEAGWALPAQAQAHQVRRVHLHPRDARGPCFARALAMGLHQGEPWYLQVDSHTCFEPGWDERLLHWGHHCRALNPRSILSCYPNPFNIVDGQPVPTVVTREVLAHVVRMDSDFVADHPVLMFEGVPVSSREPVPAFHVAAGCLFAPGGLVNEVPYDPFLYFHGEEQSLALRAWTRGWDLFHVPDMPLLHQYVQVDALPRPMHWQSELDEQRAVRSAELDGAAQQRLRALLWDGADLGAYGLGRQRSLQDYAAFSGIDYAARQIEQRARKARFGY